MLRVQGVRRFASVARLGATTSGARVVMVPHARTLVTPPDPTKPKSHPDLDEALSKESSSMTFRYLLGATGVAVGVWYYMRLQGEDVHAQMKEDEERIRKKAQELKDAGKQTVHDTVKEGHQDYTDFKTSGKEKLAQARASAVTASSDARSQLESYKKTAEDTIADATHKAEQTYVDAKNAAANSYHDAAQKVDKTRQSWGQWFGSWFGYGKK